MKLKAILFDLDDTLLWDARCVQEAFKATCEVAAKQYAVDPLSLESAVREQAKTLYETYDFFPFTKQIGINPFEGLWGEFKDDAPEEFRLMKEKMPEYRAESWTRGLRHVGIVDEAFGKQLGETFAAERRKRSIVFPDTYKVLDALKDKFQLLLLTNGSPDLQNEKLDAEPRLKEYFDHIVISGDFGQGKPAPALFDHVLQLLKIEAAEGMMVGDKLSTDIQGANGAGLTSVWINHHGIEAEDIVPKYEIRTLSELLNLLKD